MSCSKDKNHGEKCKLGDSFHGWTFLSGNVLVKDDKEEKTAGGIYIAESAQEKPQVGTVVAAGPGWTTEKGEFVETPVCIGDRVLYQKYADTVFKWEGVEYKIIDAKKIIAVRGK